MKKLRRLVIACSATLVVVALGVFGAGEVLSHPARHVIGAAPTDLRATSVELHSSPTERVQGWMARGNEGAGAVLLLHGVRADRRQMVDRAKFLNRLGFSVLLIDLPAHGESDGERITYGWREAEGVRAALSFMSRELPSERIGVIGVSLGAASLVLAKPSPSPSAVVLESMFPSIEEAVSDRLQIYLGPIGPPLSPLLLSQLPLRLGISPDQLRPIATISDLHAPLLVISGSSDRHTTLSETRRIFEAANGPKELWVIENAAHVDLHAFAPASYEARVGAFLALHLRKPG